MPEAIGCVSALLDIIDYLHSTGSVHRDVKPANIMLREGDIRRPVLVDLGLVYSERDEQPHQTEHGQEMGNRFLRLPELAAGSIAKQDPASDVAFAAGVLFFLLTGEHPYTLLDSAGRMPHQRDAVAKFREDAEFLRLLPVFDRAFQYRVEDRFSGTTELNDAILRAMAETTPIEGHADDYIARIQSDLANPHFQRDAARQSLCASVIRIAHKAIDEIAGELAARYVRTQTGHSPFEGGEQTQVGLAERHDHSRNFFVLVRAQVIGTELVVTVDEKQVVRLPAENADLSIVTAQLRTEFSRAASEFHAGTRPSGA
jgi:serine/threonine-protein kinase